MAQPKKSTGRSPSGDRKRSGGTRSPGARSQQTRSQASARDGQHEQLARLLSPLDMVLITRDRIQDVADDAVARGRMTRDDATELVGELMRRGKRTTEDIVADVEQLLGRSREGLEDARTKTRKAGSASADRVLREVDRARRATGLGAAFPISNYDDLTAAQVTSRLGDLTPAELRKVRDYERRNANRKSVLSAVEGKLS